MRDEARLTKVMAAATPTAPDAAFVIAVLQRAETARFRAQALRALLRGAGFAAAAAGAAAPILLAVPVQALVEGLAATAALLAFVVTARRAAARLTE